MESAEAISKENGSVEEKVGIVCKDWKIEGMSVGGQETYIIIPNLRLCFDMGTSSEAILCDTVCISHGHPDHIGSLQNHARLRSLRKMPQTPTYIMPKECVKPFTQLYSACLALDKGKDTVELVQDGSFAIVEASVGTEYELKRGGLTVRALSTHHTVPSLGYCLFAKRKKRKPEFQSLTGKELAELKKQKHIEVDEVVEVPVISFTGDTVIDSVISNRWFTEAEVLIMECTFLDDSVTQKQAHAGRHIHIKDIIDNKDEFKNEHIVLIHFSARYKKKEIESYVEQSGLQSALKNTKLHLLLNGFS